MFLDHVADPTLFEQFVQYHIAALRVLSQVLTEMLRTECQAVQEGLKYSVISRCLATPTPVLLKSHRRVRTLRS